MIIEQNVPASIRNWAYCLVEISRYEEVIRLLNNGDYFSMGTWGLCRDYIRRYGEKDGRKKYSEKYCIPESMRLKRRCSRYRALADRIQLKSEVPPESRLLSKNEALSMIGSTLHYKVHGKECYETLQSCSEDGSRIYTSGDDLAGLNPLSLLSLGFGKTLK